jgi:hypothetical protein
MAKKLLLGVEFPTCSKSASPAVFEKLMMCTTQHYIAISEKRSKSVANLQNTTKWDTARRLFGRSKVTQPNLALQLRTADVLHKQRVQQEK